MKKGKVKEAGKVLCTKLDMCVSTMFSPFAGVLYTVSAFEKPQEKKGAGTILHYNEAPQ